MAARARWHEVVLLVMVGCRGGAGVSPRPAAESLPAGLVARVAKDGIPAALVERIAQRQGVGAVAARDRAIQDALFAAEAHSQAAQDPRLRRAESAVLARGLIEQVSAQARAQGPIGARELAQAKERRWLEVDRPAAVRTVHAVVVVKDPGEEPAARRLAEQIAGAVRDAPTPAEFLSRARDVPPGGLVVRAEAVPPVSVDGRMVDPDAPARSEPQRFDLAFARAAHALGRVGDQSPVVRSQFGYHVIMLIERLEERRLPAEEGRRLLENDVLTERAKRLLEEMLNHLRTSGRVEVLPTAAELTAGVNVGHEP